MSEILFRGKRVDNGEWVKGIPVETEADGGIRIFMITYARWDSDDNSIDFLETDVYEVEPKTVGQYTGLTDKNGNKIFEGDILKAIWQHLSNTDTVIGIVKYDDAAFILETDDHYLFFEDNIFSDECEVVGNIHDDHELLEKSNET